MPATTTSPIVVNDLAIGLRAIIDRSLERADAFPDAMAFATAVEDAIEMRATQVGWRLTHPDRVRIGCEAVLAFNHRKQQRGAAA